MRTKYLHIMTYGLLFVGIIALSACSSLTTREDQYHHFETVGSKGWSLDEELFFSTSSLDSLADYKVDLIIRLEHSFPYNSLPIGVTFETPSRELTTQVIHIPVDKSGWNKGGFNFFEKQVTLSERMKYPESGVYTYSFRHLMADSLVQGVVELGLIIKPK